MNVMKKAWGIAKEAVVKFGGKVKEYFAESLKLAWSLVKSETGAIGYTNNVIRKEWTTSRGSKIVFEYTTQKETTVTNLFEEVVTRTKKGIFPKFLSVNGTAINTWNTKRAYKEHKLSCGVVEFNGTKGVMNIDMPEDISLAIYGPFEKTEVKKEEKPNSLRCQKCGEFCYSDCSAH